MPSATAQTAHVYGSPGARLRGLGLLKSLWPLILIFMALGYLLRAALPAPHLSGPMLGGAFLAIGIFVAAAANAARTRLANYMKGARGEEAVARTLATLSSAYHVLHGVALRPGVFRVSGGADIDHVVIGPNGLFAIETKHWQGVLSLQDGQILQDGDLPDVDPLEQALDAATCLAACLEEARIAAPPVIPILAFSASAPPASQPPPNRVVVTSADALPPLIRTHANTPPTPLNEATIKQILKLLLQKVET